MKDLHFSRDRLNNDSVIGVIGVIDVNDHVPVSPMSSNFKCLSSTKCTRSLARVQLIFPPSSFIISIIIIIIIIIIIVCVCVYVCVRRCVSVCDYFLKFRVDGDDNSALLLAL